MTHSLTNEAGASLDNLLRPKSWISPSQVNADSTIIPAEPGVYGWWFSRNIGSATLEGCRLRDGFALAYVGIAPSNASSRGNLRKRLKQHCRGPLRVSTLRRTLAALLRDEQHYNIERRGKRLYMASYEQALTAWMETHARISFITCAEPWLIEATLLVEGRLPLNVQGNAHEFRETLAKLRRSITR